MKASLLALFVCALAAPAVAAEPTGGMHGGHGSHAAVSPVAAAALSEGSVRKIDTAAGKLTLKHGPLVNLNMPPMTMAFKLRDPALLKGLKVGDAVRFRAEEVDGVLTVTALEVTK